MSTRKQRVVIVGNGMVGHRFVERLSAHAGAAEFEITVIGEERGPAYDRVNLSKFFEGKDAGALTLATREWYEQAGVRLILGDAVAALDREAKCLTTRGGLTLSYDKLVLATGSSPFVPPIEGRDAPGCFVYRTLDDLEAIRDYAANENVGVVIGGGLLGLEAANALRNLGLETHVVEMAPRLMPVQVDDIGGAILRRRIEALGVAVHLGVSAKQILADDRGQVAGLQFTDGGELPAEVIVFSAGIRPRDELARAAGLAIGPRGGVEVDPRCRTSDPDILAVGECA